MCYLVRGPQGLEERQAHALAALKDGWAAELRRQRESWAAAERSRREQWMQGKTAEVKQLTVKGLEVEVRHICMHTHTHTLSLTCSQDVIILHSCKQATVYQIFS